MTDPLSSTSPPNQRMHATRWRGGLEGAPFPTVVVLSKLSLGERYPEGPLVATAGGPLRLRVDYNTAIFRTFASRYFALA